MELQKLRDCLDRILKLDGIAFLQVSGCYNDEEKDKFFVSYYDSYFDNLLVESSKDGQIEKVTCPRINVDCKPNICELLDNIDRGDILSDMLFHTIEYDIKYYEYLEYNESPLYLTPFYRLKEEVDNVWEDAQARKAKEEAARNAKEEAERKAKEEAERKAKEEAERKAKEEAERKAKEEAERKAKEEAERKAKEEAERKAKEEAERKAKEEAERKAKEEAERKAKEEAERKAKEEAERKAKEEAERNSYKSLIEEFVSDTKECEYKDGIIFGKKKTIRYVATPITKHIWNVVVNKSAESDFDDDEYVPQKELGDFIKELNAHFEGSVVFEYLHKNIHASVHLQVYEKLDKNACFVYIKEDNR